MPTSVRATCVSHMNIVVEDFDTCVAHMRDLFGAEFLSDLPGPNWHACLMEIGNVIIEFFAPPHFMLHARIGPHYLGVEYQADVEQARAAVASHGIRIMRDLDIAFHTDPADGFGADYEFFGLSFHRNEGGYLNKQELKPLSYWRDEHPLGCIGQKGYTHAVGDIEAASRFLQSFLDRASDEPGAPIVVDGVRIDPLTGEVLGDASTARAAAVAEGVTDPSEEPPPF